MSGIGYAGAWLGGLLTVLSPCAALLVPSFFAYAFSPGVRLLGRTAVFFAGLLVTLVPLGMAAGAFGMGVDSRRTVVVTVLSSAVIALGVLQALRVQLPRRWAVPDRARQARRTRPARPHRSRRDPRGVVAVFVLGATYGVAGVCSGPVLGSVLAVAALGADPAYGAALLGVYAAGMVMPVVALAVVWQRWEPTRRWRWLRPRAVRVLGRQTTVVSLISGTLFVAVGLLLLATGGTADLGGLLSIDEQFRLESLVLGWTASVPDALAVTLAGVVVLLVLTRRHWPRRKAGVSNQSAGQSGGPPVENEKQDLAGEGSGQDPLRQPVRD